MTVATLIPVHPRVCGEHSSSSKLGGGGHRSIPACAGNTAAAAAEGLGRGGPSPRVRGTRPASQGQRRLQTVHPRVCGEHPGVSWAE